MNILLVTPFPSGHVGGVTTFVTRLQHGITQSRRHKATLLVPAESDRITDLAGCGESEMYGICARGIHFPGARLKGVLAFCVYLPLTLYELWAFLRGKRVQVVNVHYPIPTSAYFCVLRAVSSWKLVVTLHGSDVYALVNRTWLFRMLVRVVLSRADCIVAGTAHLIEAMKAQYPGLRTPTRVIPNGIMLVDGEPPTGAVQGPALPDSYILSVGNLIVRKGYDVLLRAMARARDGGSCLPLVIVGDGPEAASLAALARHLNIEDRVVFAGRRAHSEVAAFYTKARFFVHPAREEAQGLVLVEAMSSRKAVIASRVLGIPELVRDGETGVLVEAGDVDALAHAIVRLEGDDALREGLAERAYTYVTREHSWDRFVTRYLDVYEAAAGSTTPRRATQPSVVTQDSE